LKYICFVVDLFYIETLQHLLY